MKKRRSGRGKSKKNTNKPNLVSANSDDEYGDTSLDPTSQGFMNDDIDDFHEQEEKLLIGDTKFKRQRDESDEEEVYALSYDGSDDERDLASDMEDAEMPDDELAWGKNRASYYSTDYIDGDYGGFQGSDAELAEEEEKEAKVIQKRLLQTLDEADYDIETLKTLKRPLEDVSQAKIRKDLSQLNKHEKLDIVMQESPELPNILEDFKIKINELLTKFQPLADATRGENSDDLGVEYIRLKEQVILNYCTNVCFYAMLKAKRIPIENHPVIKRMVTYRNLMRQILPLDEKLKKQVEIMCSEISKGNLEIVNRKRKNDGKINTSGTKRQAVISKFTRVKGTKDIAVAADAKSKKKGGDKIGKAKEGVKIKDVIEKNELPLNEEISADGKRAVNYKILKNKGMRAYRKKELRNPRVSNKLKYRKALIRRKGQYRAPRKEIERYGGEASGVNARVSKSVKFK